MYNNKNTRNGEAIVGSRIKDQENNNQGDKVQAPLDVPASAARGYITDMLEELCTVAQQSGQEDLYILLKLTTQATRNTLVD